MKAKPPHPLTRRYGSTWIEPEMLTKAGAYGRRAFVVIQPSMTLATLNRGLPTGQLRLVVVSIAPPSETIPARLRVGRRTWWGRISLGLDHTLNFVPTPREVKR